MTRTILAVGVAAAWLLSSIAQAQQDSAPQATREFALLNDRAYLGGEPITLWGLRCGNALHSQAILERHLRNLDNMVAHGINFVGVYIQGTNAGWPDPDIAINGFTRDGKLKPDVADRLESLIRAADHSRE